MLSYSVTTNFRLELIEPSARGVSIFYFGRGETSKERRREHGSNLVRLKHKKKLLTLNLSYRRLYKYQAKISEHDVCIYKI